MTDFGNKKILMVIPSLNGGILLKRMLPTLRFNKSIVIVLDQGSTDETANICAEFGVQILQLGRAHTYTEACNIGAQIARDRGSDYLCVSNNDIKFRTDVLTELLAEMERDPQLGIVAPSQIIITDNIENEVFSRRVYWNLHDVEFHHETQLINCIAMRLESDFCELTCALVRMSAIDVVGFLDDAFGFYHEDADFGFRLRKEGYSCAYLLKSQIFHYSGSTFNNAKNNQKAAYISRNKAYFAKKHLGFGVAIKSVEPKSTKTWSSFSRDFRRYIRNYGLIEENAPELAFSNQNSGHAHYLFTNFQGTRVPEQWIEYKIEARAIFSTSQYMRKIFVNQGFVNSLCIPFGVEPDIFNPWGPTSRSLRGEKTYLAFVDGTQKQLLDIVIKSWHRFASTGKIARLVLYGHSLGGCLGRSPDTAYRSGTIEISQFKAEKIDVYEVLSPLGAEETAQFYRAADYTILGCHGDFATLCILQSIACGTPMIFGNSAPVAELAIGKYSPFEITAADTGTAISTQLLVAQVVARLEESYRLSANDRDAIASEGINKIRGQSTLRHSAMALYLALGKLQAQDPSAPLKRLERNLLAHTTSATFGRRLNKLAARRVESLGRLMLQFGSSWQEKGLAVANREAAGKLKHFVARGTKELLSWSSRIIRRFQIMVNRFFVHQPAFQGRSVLLIGYIDAQLGLGQSLRGMASAMARSEINFSIYPFGIGVEDRRSVSHMPERYDITNAHEVNVIEVAPDELPTVFRHVSKTHFDRSYNILRTYWELSKAPEIWRPQLKNIHEIWAPGAFVAESLRNIFDRPIIVVPPCIQPPSVELDGHKRFALNKNRFYFLFSFDYFSFPQRKNPLAVVRAFVEAFPDRSSCVGLIVKSTGSVGHFPHIKQAIRAAALNDIRIEIIDESISRQEMLALLAATDCYVSLHRSEGFGLGMAEAMTFEKPVIATDYSGSTDFLNIKTGFPVPYKLRAVARDEYVHAEGQVWADPDEAACSAAMVYVFSNRKEAAIRARAGKRFVDERYSPLNVGRIMEQRLSEIFDLRFDTLDLATKRLKRT